MTQILDALTVRGAVVLTAGNPRLRVNDTGGNAALQVGTNGELALNAAGQNVTAMTLGNKGHVGAQTGNTEATLLKPIEATQRVLIVRGFLSQTADLQHWQDSTGVILVAVDKDGKLLFGPSGSQDTNLYRSAANTLKTDDTFLVTSNVALKPGGAGQSVLDGYGFYFWKTAGETNPTNIMIGALSDAGGVADTPGFMFGPGGAARDTNIFRAAANILKTDDEFQIGINGGKDTLSLTNTTADVGITIGGDTNLYRSAANALKTDDALEVAGALTTGGVAVSTTAHTHTALVPTGGLVMHAGDLTNPAPTGWLWANGQSLAVASYPALYSAIGYVYGGSGANFNVPNLCYADDVAGTPTGEGRFPLGKRSTGTANAMADTGGTLGHTHSGPSHNHSTNSHSHVIPPAGDHSHTITAASMSTATNTGTSGGGTRLTDGQTHAHGGSTAGSGSHEHSGATNVDGGGDTTGNAGTGDTGSANPPYQVVGYIIKT